MARLLRPNSRDDFEIAIICALLVERNAVEALLEEVYETDGFSYGKAAGDLNAYTTGRLGNQDVVLAYMPSMGTISAAVVASNLRFSFRKIKVGIIVGVCGGVPETPGGVQIFLGDVIISTSVVRIDYGWQYPNGIIQRDRVENTLKGANPEILAFVEKISGYLGHNSLEDSTNRFSAQICTRDGFSGSAYPGPSKDVLYSADYRHKHQTGNCHTCNICNDQDDEVCNMALKSSCEDLGCDTVSEEKRDRVQRETRIDSSRSQMTSMEVQGAKPSIHFGPMACSNQVMKSGQHRDEIAAEDGVIGFEMESAGTWESIPTLVIKSVCDYADSHKNKTFQPYAAARAAACTKAVLEEWRSEDGITESKSNIALISCGSVDQINHSVETQSFQGNALHGPVNYHMTAAEAEASFQATIDGSQAAVTRSNGAVQRSQQQRRVQSDSIANLHNQITTSHNAFYGVLPPVGLGLGLILTRFWIYIANLWGYVGSLCEITSETERTLGLLAESEQETEATRGEVILETEQARRMQTELSQRGSAEERSVGNEVIGDEHTTSVLTWEGADNAEAFVHQAEDMTLKNAGPQINRDDSQANAIPTQALLFQGKQVGLQPDQMPGYSSREAISDPETQQRVLRDRIDDLQRNKEQLDRSLEQIQLEIQANKAALEAERRQMLEIMREIERLKHEKQEREKEERRNRSWFNICVIL